ncbi:MAG: hypothetical protein GY941_15525 [Planctomycetes bacterium]|nr:hypothetical protein [Planctomycetota bacterium]
MTNKIVRGALPRAHYDKQNCTWRVDARPSRQTITHGAGMFQDSVRLGGTDKGHVATCPYGLIQYGQMGP